MYQTLRDESCLVPCAGLYADIANDVDSLQQATEALEQNVVRGQICLFLCIHRWNQGFQKLTEEMSAISWRDYESKDRMIAALKQIFPALAASKVDEVTRLTETYHKYKREYVKHILFELNSQ